MKLHGIANYLIMHEVYAQYIYIYERHVKFKTLYQENENV